jgi:site-specific recombinase XerC
MSAVAPTLEAFFTQRLIRQKRASQHTIAAYRDGFRLLLAFTQDRTGKAPSQLEFGDLDAPAIGAFLDHLQRERGNSAQS